MDFARPTPLFLALAALALSGRPAAAAPLFDSQWALENTGQHECNFRGRGCTDGVADVDIKYKLVKDDYADCSQVIVAVLDTGVDFSHPDLADNLLPGKSFVDGTRAAPPQDDNLHGTHVTGIIAGEGTLDGGIVGVCRYARVLPVKVGNAQGELSDADILSGIQYAVSQGARVVNGSFGGPEPDVLVQDAIREASNVLFVFAAGNGDASGVGYDIDQQPSYPASYSADNIVAVAATDATDQLGSFSNFGARSVHLAAPGVNIVSTLPMRPTAEMNQYGIPTEAGPLDGTSMATPYVTGALTMLLGSNPSLTAAQAKNRLLAGVDLVPALAGKVQSGGRLNLAKLMGAI